jgi:hypothetical protein
LNIDSLEQAGELTDQQLCDGQRIYQGEVEDKWFLNALSMVAVEPKVFREVNCLDPGTFKEFSELGLYIFKFYKHS